jgi:hypothetical protein
MRPMARRRSRRSSAHHAGGPVSERGLPAGTTDAEPSASGLLRPRCWAALRRHRPQRAARGAKGHFTEAQRAAPQDRAGGAALKGRSPTRGALATIRRALHADSEVGGGSGSTAVWSVRDWSPSLGGCATVSPRAHGSRAACRANRQRSRPTLHCWTSSRRSSSKSSRRRSSSSTRTATASSPRMSSSP